MAHELTKRRLNILKKEPAPIVYDDLRFDKGYEADLIVENKVIVELKSVETVHPVHKKQRLTYLRLADRQLGLMINFGEALIKDGIIFENPSASFANIFDAVPNATAAIRNV